MKQLTDHPLAELFPMLDSTQMKELVADIKANGLRQPIYTYEDKILDGRNRYRACLTAGVSPVFKPFVGKDPLKFVVSLNVHRRHLTDDQRAAIAVGIANAKVGNPTIKSNTGLVEMGQSSHHATIGITNKKAAEVMKVSEAKVDRAKKVAKASAEDLKKVVHGLSTLAEVEAAQKKERQASEPPKPIQGRQKVDLRNFVRLENDLGACLRKIDALNKECPNDAHHQDCLSAVKDAMSTVKEWQKVARG